VHSFVQGLSTLVINEAATTAFNFDMNCGKMVAFTQADQVVIGLCDKHTMVL